MPMTPGPGITFTPRKKPAAPTAPPFRLRLPCAHEGKIVSECRLGFEALHVRQCLHPTDGAEGNCSRAPTHDAQCCGTCDFWERERPSAVPSDPPVFPIRFDHQTLWPEVPGYRFNPSLLKTPDGYLFACRNGWAGSEIWVGNLDHNLYPQGRPEKLGLLWPEANIGREDPRLFWYQGRPHVAYIGFAGRNGVMKRTHQLYARLSQDGFHVEKIFCPTIGGRRAWEKNHGYFEHGGELYAVYTISPHKVLRVVEGETSVASEVPFPGKWRGGFMSGGAPPVLVGNEFWNFFHDRVEAGRRVYRMGLYTFSADPPFEPKRWMPDPILSADEPQFSVPHDNYCDVVFPCGAALVDGSWLISMGVHDRWSEIHRLSHSELEGRLRHFDTPH